MGMRLPNARVVDAALSTICPPELTAFPVKGTGLEFARRRAGWGRCRSDRTWSFSRYPFQSRPLRRLSGRTPTCMWLGVRVSRAAPCLTRITSVGRAFQGDGSSERSVGGRPDAILSASGTNLWTLRVPPRFLHLPARLRQDLRRLPGNWKRTGRPFSWQTRR